MPNTGNGNSDSFGDNMNEQMIEQIEAIPTETPQGTIVEEQKPAPEDMAAAFFRMQKPRLLMLIEKLSAKQMRRILVNACSYPFVDRAYEPKNETERAVAFLANEMVVNKTIMQ